MVTSIKVVVLHTMYGCDTGCCGHVVELAAGSPEDQEDARQIGAFEFLHPAGKNLKEWARKLASAMVQRTFGEDHVADLDWEHSCVIDD